MAFPAILRRLFANNGAGPLLRADIIPRDVQADTYRLSRIGCPHYLSSTVLPAEYMWADGSLALFSDWPEFSARYNAGAFANMVMPYGSNQNVYMGKFVINANNTGLYLPRHGGQFVRGWTPGNGEAGQWYRDEIRNITGGITAVVSGMESGTGVLSGTNSFAGHFGGGGYGSRGTMSLNAAWQVPTGPENVPPHVRQPVSVYMGRRA